MNGDEMLKVTNLSAAYGDKVVLNKINFELPSGKIFGLIGPNGAGKSTLIRTLSGVLPLRSGIVTIDGQNVSELSTLERARKVAVVPQAQQMPPAFSALETVQLGRTPHLNWLGQLSESDSEIVRSAMIRTHTWEFADRRVGELSGGEQQRVLLARALAQSAPILMLDEPTSNLDLQYQISLLDQVYQLAHEAGLSVLIALHDLNLVARYTDQVGLMVAGEFIRLGKPKEVLTPEILSRAYQVPLQVVQQFPGGFPVILPASLAGTD